MSDECPTRVPNKCSTAVGPVQALRGRVQDCLPELEGMAAAEGPFDMMVRRRTVDHIKITDSP